MRTIPKMSETSNSEFITSVFPINDSEELRCYNKLSRDFVKTYDHQRNIKKEKVKNIITFLEDENPDGFINSIGGIWIAGVTEDDRNTLYILDGQHRFEAYLQLIEGNYNIPSIPIHVYIRKNKSEFFKIFKTINLAEPVNPIYLDPTNKLCIEHIIKEYRKEVIEPHCKKLVIKGNPHRIYLKENIITNLAEAIYRKKKMRNILSTDLENLFKKFCNFTDSVLKGFKHGIQDAFDKNIIDRVDGNKREYERYIVIFTKCLRDKHKRLGPLQRRIIELFGLINSHSTRNINTCFTLAQKIGRRYIGCFAVDNPKRKEALGDIFWDYVEMKNKK